MKNYILLLGILFFISCKTKEDYSKYTYIDEGIESKEYEVTTLISEKNELKTIYGYTIPVPNKIIDSLNTTKKIREMPLILYNSLNNIYFISYDKKNFFTHIMEYNISNNQLNTLVKEDTIQKIKNFFKEKEKNEKLINFKFPEAEKYYKTKSELKDTISKENIKIIYEKYPDNEKKRNQMKNLMSIYYKTDFINLHMPNENIKFKYNLLGNGKIIFFDTEELYKKGYIFIYIYNISNIFPHSGGLYVIRPKTKK